MTSRLAALPGFNFDSNAIEPRHRLDAWTEFYKGFYAVESRAETPEAISFSARSWRLGPLVAGRYAYSAAITSTPPKVNIDNRVVLRIYLRGTSRSIVEESPVRFGTGAVHLLDRSRPYRGASDDVDMLILSAPHDAIGYDPSRHAGYGAFTFDTPLGRMLRANIETIYESLPTADVDEGTALADGFTAMLRAIVTRDLRDESARHHFEQGRETAIRRYIADHLRDPALGVGRICQANGVSRTTLYRIFEQEGGVAQHVRRRRLEGALVELSQSPPRRGLIGEVALRWGFPDLAEFSRQFRAQFGFRPGDVAGSLSAGPAAPRPRESDDRAAAPVTPLASLIG